MDEKLGGVSEQRPDYIEAEGKAFGWCQRRRDSVNTSAGFFAVTRLSRLKKPRRVL